jgi:hypothetical protein
VSGRAVPVAGGAGASPEQVLRRAIALADDAVSPAIELRPEHLAEVAAQLEIPAAAVAAALAESRLCEGLPAAGPVSRLVGPVAVVGWRRVEADPAAVEALVSRWLEVRYALRVRSRADGTLVATRRPGLGGSVARTARALSGGSDLAGRGEVRATVVPEIEPGPEASTPGAVACVLVDLRRRRREAVGLGGVVGATGLAVSGLVAAVVAAPVLVAGVPLSVAAAATAAALQHRSTVRTVTEEVEVALDALARRQEPTGAVASLVRTIGRRAAPAR